MGWLFLIELPWVTAAAIGVNLSYLLLMPPPLTWALIAAAALPLFVRLGSGGYASIRTPFDLPIALSLGAAAVGLWVSPVKETGLGGFQSLLAAVLGYYALSLCRYPAVLLRVMLPLGGVMLALALLFVFRQGPMPAATVNDLNSWAFELAQRLPALPSSPRYPHLALGANHGLALALAIGGIIGICLGLLGRRLWVRLVSLLGAAVFSLGMLLLTTVSLWQLFTLESIRGRIPLWLDTVRMVEEPLTGIGLGSWASLYNQGKVVSWATHPHNAYLELYSGGGALGLVALLLFVAVWIRLSWGVFLWGRGNPWYGLGVGIVLSGAVAALVGVVETAPVAIPMTGADRYLYVVSPIPWLMAALLVLTHRLLTGGARGPRDEAGKPLPALFCPENRIWRWAVLGQFQAFRLGF